MFSSFLSSTLATISLGGAAAFERVNALTNDTQSHAAVFFLKVVVFEIVSLWHSESALCVAHFASFGLAVLFAAGGAMGA